MSFPAAAIPDIEAIVPPGTQSERYYVTQEWTLNYLANLLYLDFDKLAEVKLVRGLSNFDICTMPESRMQRAIVKAAELMPDSPGEAASFRERQRWGNNGKADPMRLSSAMAAREATLAANTNARRSTVGEFGLVLRVSPKPPSHQSAHTAGSNGWRRLPYDQWWYQLIQGLLCALA